MKLKELRRLIENGALSAYQNLYSDLEAQRERFLSTIDSFAEMYGSDRDIMILSVPGRSEICGNHTDHNRGCVIAGAIDRDIIAVTSRRDDGTVKLTSKGYYESTLSLSEVCDPTRFEHFKSRSLIAGVIADFINRGYGVGGFDAYTDSDVLKGSGLSSSAAFEVMVGNILNYLYNDGKIDNKELAKSAKYAENVYFGKPCGLMDQMAAAVGGFVYIDFENEKDPEVKSIDFSLDGAGYSLCIIGTGGSHSELNDEFAAIPSEMKAVATALGCEVLREADREKFLKQIPALREKLGDRAVLRAMHFFNENDRVKEMAAALEAADTDAFVRVVKSSGVSSATYLQNVFTPRSIQEQGITLALCLADGFLKEKKAAFRVHGGGFAGTAQVFIPKDIKEEFATYMDSVFGEGATMTLNIRPLGAVKLF